ncbi:lysophospholipid acyltransferase family protein [Roseobacter sinensis]|uniref:Lysophospholipid acyltransferase family protein n=1 Tax=Roseobacter sinensis TaxID=2931391 RepID=A0ABT3BEX9_9RHOB|nr:lysophospholipid acyltransferase family protein [Roseobacter sp. WL0113]MCV3272113.1 lysophospholipid acyltransferase family protein [Roseobacter sp. WL0113]
MKERLDPLIAERAPWLFRPGTVSRVSRRTCMALLGYHETVSLAVTLKNEPAADLMHHMGHLLAQDVRVGGLHHVPRTGPAIVVANHPTGIADGIMLHHLLSPIRPDLFFYANADILRVLPQLSEMIAPVEWRNEKRCHGKARETMAYTRDAVAQQRLGVIFPSGRLAKRRGLRLYERPWMASAAMIARKYDLPVIPIHIEAHNSALFYILDLLHPTLRDITLFHETLNKERQPFRIRVGAPIAAADLPKSSDAGIAMLRNATLALGAGPAGSVRMLAPRYGHLTAANGV